ncbi:ABC transporter ATP-binding protein [Alkalihalobacillus pseudalcaliphilus]|uniref:ABC transporter ATP-binding protein n=1 Tax=Alkalihalobacillus pseudalcaliphilus TaxID=79884 RepID=UPI000B2E0C01|nr:ABC transporter ATP-binding protein [Alkalihalobacillus pseudalcaliphilus]
MKVIWGYIRPYQFAMWIALILMFIELVVELIHPLLLARIIDDGIMQNDLQAVLYWGGIMVVVSLFAFIAGIVNSFFAGHVSQSTGLDLRNGMYEKVQAFSFSNLQKFQTSSLITRLTNDVTQIQNTLFMSLRIMLRAPLLVVGGVIMALLLNMQLAMFLVLTVPILLLFLVFVMKAAAKLFKLVQQKLDGVNSVIREHLGGMKLIKAYVRRKHEQKRFVDRNKQLMDKTVKALRLLETTMPILLFIMNVSIIGILWFAQSAIQTGTVQVGEVVAIINYVLRITGALTVFAMIIMVFSRAKASSERIVEVLNTDVDMQDGSQQVKKAASKEIMRFDNVSFRYPGNGDTAIKQIQLSIYKGETIAIMGGTGSGKTTMFQLIPRLYDSTAGSILINGMNVKEFRVEELRKSIAYVPQEVLLFSGTIEENIAWGREDATEEEIHEAAKSAQIHETILSLPEQYRGRIGQKGVNLSGGQKQRISIARALIRKPDILLLDDSTSALDVQTEKRFMQALQKYECTTLMITQKVISAQEADRIILLDDGKIVATGNHNELVESSKLYQRIVQSQERGGVLENA